MLDADDNIFMVDVDTIREAKDVFFNDNCISSPSYMPASVTQIDEDKKYHNIRIMKNCDESLDLYQLALTALLVIDSDGFNTLDFSDWVENSHWLFKDGL